MSLSGRPTLPTSAAVWNHVADVELFYNPNDQRAALNFQRTQNLESSWRPVVLQTLKIAPGKTVMSIKAKNGM
jgi:hypothetical protein